MNIIVTCPRNAEPDAIQEMMSITDNEINLQRTGISGILTGTIPTDPIELSHDMQRMVLDEPWSVRYVRRVIPIQGVVRTDMDDIQDVIRQMKDRIPKEAQWRVSIKKRNSGISSQEIISRIAEIIPNKVSLEEPDVIVQVEILGGITGVAVVSPGDIFSLDKAKRSLSED